MVTASVKEIAAELHRDALAIAAYRDTIIVSIYGIIYLPTGDCGISMTFAMMSETLPVVLDTNVLVAGACRHEGSHAYVVLLAVLHGRVPLILTPSIAFEYADVLARERVMTVTGLTLKQSADLVTDLIALSNEVQVNFTWRPNLLDESDNKFIEAAIHAAATIVTYNKRDFMVGELPPHGWSVMTPHEFCARYL